MVTSKIVNGMLISGAIISLKGKRRTISKKVESGLFKANGTEEQFSGASMEPTCTSGRNI